MEQTVETSTRFWDDIAERYAKKPVANPGAYQRKLALTKARLRPDDVILDIGCGTGSLALELAPHVSFVHALDLSAQMVKIANRKAQGAGVHNVTFYRGKIEHSVPLPRKSFDVICAYNLLHLVDDLESTITKIFALLEPGGSFISSTACLRDTWVPYGLVLPVMRWWHKAPPVLMLRAQRVQDLMRAAGFVDIRREKVSEDSTNLFVLARKPG